MHASLYSDDLTHRAVSLPGARPLREPAGLLRTLPIRPGSRRHHPMRAATSTQLELSPVTRSTMAAAEPDTKNIGCIFECLNDHAVGCCGADSLCVEWSGGRTIGWEARLRFYVNGIQRNLGSQFPNNIYVRSVYKATTNATQHNNMSTSKLREGREYWKIASTGFSIRSDRHMENSDYLPLYTTGVCAIKTTVSLSLSLVVLPKGPLCDDPVPDGVFIPTRPQVNGKPGKNPNDHGRFEREIQERYMRIGGFLQGETPAPGWAGLVFVVDFSPSVSHCGEGLLAEDPVIPSRSGYKPGTPTPPDRGGGTPTPEDDPVDPHTGEPIPRLRT
jgi:hypothetical protein